MPEADTEAQPLVLQVHDSPALIDALAWNGLLAGQPAPNPFMRHEYLLALHESKSAVPRSGWTPQFVTLQQGRTLLAACALYLKRHSYGEYVFDWAWADAYQRHGLPYYPKLLGAVPFTPVPGTRLLARDAAARGQLAHGIIELVRRAELSSAHLLFIDDADQAALESAGWMIRHGVQFHWTQTGPAPWPDFAAFLASLQREKRKKIQQEQRRVLDAGVRFEVYEGESIGLAQWDFFYRCYTLTYQAHGSMPYLRRDFFARMANTMPEHWVMFIAEREGEPIAASLITIDPERRAAYGRYWGCIEQVSCLHFDACYYQPLAWCIANGYRRFEGGAQGEHKMARGLLPTPTASAHWLSHPDFADAVARFLEQEGQGVEAYVDELRERNPFKPAPGS